MSRNKSQSGIHFTLEGLGCPHHFPVNVILGGFIRGERGFSWPHGTDVYSPFVSAACSGATKSSLLSAPSIVSMFVPAPEEFTDEQPTVMTDK